MTSLSGDSGSTRKVWLYKLSTGRAELLTELRYDESSKRYVPLEPSVFQSNKAQRDDRNNNKSKGDRQRNGKPGGGGNNGKSRRKGGRRGDDDDDDDRPRGFKFGNTNPETQPASEAPPVPPRPMEVEEEAPPIPPRYMDLDEVSNYPSPGPSRAPSPPLRTPTPPPRPPPRRPNEPMQVEDASSSSDDDMDLGRRLPSPPTGPVGGVNPPALRPSQSEAASAEPGSFLRNLWRELGRGPTEGVEGLVHHGPIETLEQALTVPDALSRFERHFEDMEGPDGWGTIPGDAKSRFLHGWTRAAFGPPGGNHPGFTFGGVDPDQRTWKRIFQEFDGQPPPLQPRPQFMDGTWQVGAGNTVIERATGRIVSPEELEAAWTDQLGAPPAPAQAIGGMDWERTGARPRTTTRGLPAPPPSPGLTIVDLDAETQRLTDELAAKKP